MWLSFSTLTRDLLKKLSNGTVVVTMPMQTILDFLPRLTHLIAKHNQCHSDIRNWMAANFLKLNDDKTELVLRENPKRLTNTNDLEL